MTHHIRLIDSVKTNHKAVAFTFDDGPNPFYTPQVLEIFEKVSGHATFFMIGEQMVKSPEVVNQVIERGHEIGNHTYTHSNLTELNADDCYKEIESTDQLITKLTGQKPKLLRPPFLSFNQEVGHVVERFDYHAISALNTDATDWEQPGVEHIFTKSLAHVDNGSILIFHDGFGDRSQTIEAVRQLVTRLSEQGYELVTVSQLLQFADGE